MSQPLCALVLLGDHSVNMESLMMTPSNRKDRSSQIKQHGLCGHRPLFPKQSTLRVGYHGCKYRVSLLSLSLVWQLLQDVQAEAGFYP